MSEPTARIPVYAEKDRQTPRALVSVPMTPAEWRRLRTAARRREVALSRFLREAALEAAGRPVRQATEDAA